MKKILLYTFLFAALFTISCRKKYPENTMKCLQKPKNYDLMRGFITEYKVNGIDSLDYLNKYIGSQFYCIKDIKQLEFVTFDTHNRSRVYNSCFGKASYNWNDNYNYININHNNDTAYLKKNIFLINGQNWKILKLIPSKKTEKHQLKIQSEINGNLYEIQFN